MPRNRHGERSLAALGLCLALLLCRRICDAADRRAGPPGRGFPKDRCSRFHRAAKAVLSRLLKIIRIVPEARNLMGVCEVELGGLDAAAASFQRAIELKPSYDSAHLNLASVLLRQGKQVEATEALRKSLALNPGILANDPNASAMEYLLALDDAQQGNPKQAEHLLRSAIQLKPDFIAGRLALAKLLLGR